MLTEAIFISKWKTEMRHLIKLRYGKLDKDKVNAYLDSIITKNMKNPRAVLENNYNGKIARTDVLSIIDLIEKNKLIIGGGGVLYQQHCLKDNPLIAYIQYNQGGRNQLKKERKKYPKGSDEWFMCDIGQNNKKIKINSFYGVHGYIKFILYNRYIAEAVTNQGRQIVCSAAEGFENFLMDNVPFTTESELFHYIHNIINEYKEYYEDKIDFVPFHISNSKYLVTKRLVNKCQFNISNETITHLETMISTFSEDELVLLYYKNNLFEFNKLSIIKNKLKYIHENLEKLHAPEMYLIEDESIKQMINDIWDFYNVFVLYDYPIFDRVRKTMYTDKKAVLYVDTDSNFIGLNKWVQYIKYDVLDNKFNKPETEIEFMAVNLCTMFLGNVVDRALKTLCKSMNTTDEYAATLKMKNEFYMDKILFTEKKKRYISNAILQEGQMLFSEDGTLGLPEIKGFDFKKSTVKPFVTDYYTDICLNDLLRQENIKIDIIFKKMLELRKDIEDSMRRGENKYYKQMNVQILEHYASPYSQQGIRAIILWNTLCPDYSLELPVDVDIIPIKDLSEKKNLEWFEEYFPEDYQRLKDKIIDNSIYYKRPKEVKTVLSQQQIEKMPNPVLMNLNYIAKPKNFDKELPNWFGPLVNTEKVVLDMLSLFYPIMKTLGMKTLKTTKNDEHLSNIVDL